MWLKYREHFVVNSEWKKEKWNYDSNLNPEIKRFARDWKIDNKEANVLKEILYFNNVKKHREKEVLKRTTRESLDKLKEIPWVTAYLKYEINKILSYSEYKTLKNISGIEKLIDSWNIRYWDLVRWAKKWVKKIRIWPKNKDWIMVPEVVSVKELINFYNNFQKSNWLRKIIDESVWNYHINRKKIEGLKNDWKFPKIVWTYINQYWKKENVILKKSVHPGFWDIKETVEYILEFDNSTWFFSRDLKKVFDHFPSQKEINLAIKNILKENKKLLKKKEIIKNAEIKKRAIKDILNFIAIAEWTTRWYNVRFHYRRVPNLSKMTINQVIRYQQKILNRYLYRKKHWLLPKWYVESTAIWRYQFMLDTLRWLIKKKGIKWTDLFTPRMQDKLWILLLKKRWLDKFLSWKISLNRFLHNLSKEWASLPDPYNKWKSHYDWDWLNSVTKWAKKHFKKLVKNLKTIRRKLRKA